MIEINIIRNELNNFVKNGDPDNDMILLAYLFGSVLKKKLDVASDIDFAFLLKSDEYLKDPIQASYPAYKTASDIGLTLNKKTDVTILNSSSLEIAYEVVKSGHCLYESDIDLRLIYESKIRGMYFDFKPFLIALRAKKIERIMKGVNL